MTKPKPPTDAPTCDDDTRTRGPEPERLKIDGAWEDAVRDALKKKPPPGGWPKPDTARGKKRRA
jgi:hypothetical protein